MGGGCHWCTEAVFQSLIGVNKVEQGFVSSTAVNDSYSEAIIVHFDPRIISLINLIEIHLRTHRSTSNHSMREKYRSAVYTFDDNQSEEAEMAISNLQLAFDKKIITMVHTFEKFKPSNETFENYYYNNTSKPFCRRHISPKLQLLLENFSEYADKEKITIQN